MFKKITVAYNESPAASRGLASAIHLARSLSADLRAVTIVQAPPAYMSYAHAADSSVDQMLNQDRREIYERLEAGGRDRARPQGVELETHLLEGDEVEAIVRFIGQHPT